MGVHFSAFLSKPGQSCAVTVKQLPEVSIDYHNITTWHAPSRVYITVCLCLHRLRSLISTSNDRTIVDMLLILIGCWFKAFHYISRQNEVFLFFVIIVYFLSFFFMTFNLKLYSTNLQNSFFPFLVNNDIFEHIIFRLWI